MAQGDRNINNFLVDRDGRVVLIDNGNSASPGLTSAPYPYSIPKSVFVDNNQKMRLTFDERKAMRKIADDDRFPSSVRTRAKFMDKTGRLFSNNTLDDPKMWKVWDSITG
jgi:hypothetical protein